jgi:hypothetical protein
MIFSTATGCGFFGSTCRIRHDNRSFSNGTNLR